MIHKEASLETAAALVDQHHERARVAARGGRLALLFLGIWMVFYEVWAGLPYIQPGAKILYNAKLAMIGRDPVFPRGAPIRVAIFGNSRILSGVIPTRFDRAVGGGCFSFNFGLPETDRFVPELERLIEAGDVPTHVLLQSPWTSDPDPSLLQWLGRDRMIVNAAFPFRTLPRDLVVFTFLSRRHGGVSAFYRRSGEIAEQVLRDRGYYFIEGQSHHEGHRLPDDFTLPTDKPGLSKPRRVTPSGPQFERLLRLARDHDIHVLLIPDHFRPRAFAPPPPTNSDAIQALALYPRFRQLGPDYVLLDNRDFADPVHANPEGARRYTDLLAGLFKADLESSAKSPDRGIGPRTR
jgi:hypothetical protein